MPAGASCQKGCDLNSNTGICECKSLSIFDVSGQIANIFAKSNLKLVANIGALFEFPIYKTLIFWIIITLTSWLLFTFIVVLWKVKKFAIVHKFHTRSLKFRKDAIMTIWLVTFEILIIFRPNIRS